MGGCEAAGLENRRRILLHPPTPSAPRCAPSRGNTLRAHGATNKSHHACARRRDGEAALFRAENDVDARRSFAAVEWHYSDRLLGQTGSSLGQSYCSAHHSFPLGFARCLTMSVRF
jgi:hypothetical protein